MSFEGWALVEQLGFRKTVGKVSEQEMYGTKLLRLDVPVITDGAVTEFVTRFCGGPSLYQITPLDEDLAIDMAKKQSDPRPVRPTQYRLENHPSAAAVEDDHAMGGDDDDEY